MRITRRALQEVNQHAGEGYPYEICGMLIAERRTDPVTQTRRVRNVMVERARDRYEMDPRDQIRIQRECDAAGLEIVGYYHSHPDHPAQASITDAQRSWAGPVYLIVSCARGRVVDANAFVAEHDGGPMRGEPLEVLHFTLERVADGVHAAIALPGSGAQGNAAIVDLGDRTLVFDTLLTPQAATALRAAAERLTGRPPTWVVNSHWHADHVLGNQVFAPEATIVATRRTRDLMLAHRLAERLPGTLASREQELAGEQDPERRRSIADELAEGRLLMEALPDLRRVHPSLTFEQRLTVHGSDRRAELLTYGGGHPDDRVALMGDLLLVRSHPLFAHGDPWALRRALERVRELDLDRLVPGHGPVGSVDDLDLLLRYLSTVEEMARSDGERALEAPVPSPFDGWAASGLFARNLRFVLERG